MKVDFWYLKTKPSAHISVKWVFFLFTLYCYIANINDTKTSRTWKRCVQFFLHIIYAELIAYVAPQSSSAYKIFSWCIMATSTYVSCLHARLCGDECEKDMPVWFTIFFAIAV